MSRGDSRPSATTSRASAGGGPLAGPVGIGPAEDDPVGDVGALGAPPASVAFGDPTPPAGDRAGSPQAATKARTAKATTQIGVGT